MKPPIDLSAYLVTDRGMARGRTLSELVTAAVRGGVTCVQLREKTCATREFMTQAAALLPMLRGAGVPLIVNDRVDVALAVGADGVHLGQTDMPLADARRICGPDRIVGVSAESVEDALAAERDGADYLGVSPIYATPTKTDTAPALGLEGLRKIRASVSIPLVGIGGLNAGNAADVIQAGADGVAVVSAIMAAEDPEAAARELALAVGAALRDRQG